MRIFSKKFHTIEDGMKILETIKRFSEDVLDEELASICRLESLKIGQKLIDMGADKKRVKALIVECCAKKSPRKS